MKNDMQKKMEHETETVLSRVTRIAVPKVQGPFLACSQLILHAFPRMKQLAERIRKECRILEVCVHSSYIGNTCSIWPKVTTVEVRTAVDSWWAQKRRRRAL